MKASDIRPGHLLVADGRAVRVQAVTHKSESRWALGCDVPRTHQEVGVTVPWDDDERYGGWRHLDFTPDEEVEVRTEGDDA